MAPGLVCVFAHNKPWSRLEASMITNNALERPSGERGRAVLAMNCVLGGAEWAPCLAAQLGR